MAKLVSAFRSFAEVAPSDPRRLFWIFAVVQLLFWTVVPIFTDPNILTDTIEGYAWGREWPLGTYKHPPLAAWILEAFAVLTHRATWVHFLISQIAVVAALWAVWQTGRRTVGESEALIGAMLLTGVGYYNFLIPEFNPNVLQLPLWALIGLSFHRAVKDNKIMDWLSLGLWGAAGMYAKYSTALLLAPLGILIIAHPLGRKRLKSAGPWLAVLACFLLLLPHLVWLVQNDFLPLTYTEERFERPSSYVFIVAPFLLILWQAAALLPAVLLYVFSFGRATKSLERRRSFDGDFLNAITFGPFILALVIAIFAGFKIRNMWGASFWNFIGLWSMFYLRPALTQKNLDRFARAWCGIFIIGIGGFAAIDVLGPYVTHKATRIHFPGAAMAAEISDAWQARYHTPLRYIVGDIWAAGNVAYYAPDRPHVLIAGDYRLSPWIVPENIKRYGGVIVWCRGECVSQSVNDVPSWYWPEFSDRAEMQSVLTIPQQTGAAVSPAKIGWAILPPQDAP